MQRAFGGQRGVLAQIVLAVRQAEMRPCERGGLLQHVGKDQTRARAQRGNQRVRVDRFSQRPRKRRAPGIGHEHRVGLRNVLPRRAGEAERAVLQPQRRDAQGAPFGFMGGIGGARVSAGNEQLHRIKSPPREYREISLAYYAGAANACLEKKGALPYGQKGREIPLFSAQRVRIFPLP